MKKVTATTEAPAAIGPYSQAVATGNLLFCSGQLPLDPKSGQILADDIVAQTGCVLENLGAILRASGMDFENVVKTTVFLTDLSEFTAMNDVYKIYFVEPFPARSTIQVAALPRGARVEIEAVAAF